MAFGQASVKRSLRAFRRDQRGAVAVWAVLIAPPLLGVAALAVDLSRIYSAQAEMQTAADALARAGALELDGSSGAITRANRAIDNLVANDQRFSATNKGRVMVDGVRFLSALPADDATAVSAGQVTTDPSLARFVEVTARPVTLTTLFPPKILGGLVNTEVGARAIGARSQRMCHAAPVFICNPVEGTGTSLLEALESPSYQGRLLSLRGKGGGADYAPGMRGFLEPPGGKSANQLKQMFAEVSPASCYDAAGVTLRPGQVSSVDQGFNTRFGIYKGSYKNTEGDYPPAALVTSYPQDDCFAAGTCDRTGDGVWNFQSYMEANHPSKGSVNIAGVTYTFNHGANTVSPSTTRPTRYQLYRWEIEQAALSPQDPDRRVLPVAVLNCQSEDLSAATVPVAGFAKVFLTQPMGEGNEDVIWGELMGALKLGVDMQVKDQVDVRR